MFFKKLLLKLRAYKLAVQVQVKAYSYAVSICLCQESLKKTHSVDALIVSTNLDLFPKKR